MKALLAGTILALALQCSAPALAADLPAAGEDREQDVSFRGGSTNVMLAGTLSLPAGAKPGERLPAVLLIHGTGRVDRDETIANHKPFRTIAEALTEAGYAVLRYDKRGCARSSGSIENITVPQLRADAEAAFDYLRSRVDIDPTRIGLLGHSEGGAIAPQIALRRPEVAWLVLLGAPTVPGREIVPYQNAQNVLDRGHSEEEAESAAATARQLFEIVEEPEEQRGADLDVALEALRAEHNLSSNFAENQKRLLLSPWFRYTLAYDPQPTLQALRQPVLMLYGELDHQIAPSLNEAPAREALKDNPRAVVRVLPELNHLFLVAKTGAVSEYATIGDGVAPQALASISDWLRSQPPSGVTESALADVAPVGGVNFAPDVVPVAVKTAHGVDKKLARFGIDQRLRQ